MSRRGLLCVAMLLGHAHAASPQTLSQRGFVEAVATGFPREAPNGSSQVLAYLNVREELFARPARWIRGSLGLEFHADSDDLVADDWQIDFLEQGTQRPRLSIRTLDATLTQGSFAVDIGKQFIRWGRTDFISPTDRFAPKDFLNVFDPELLGVTGIRGRALFDRYAFEVAFVPWFTPSRIPVPGQRWAIEPPGLADEAILDRTTTLPEGTQKGVRVGYLGDRIEYSLSFFDGFNHLPDIRLDTASLESPAPPTLEFLRVYPRIRVYGFDCEIPNRWFTFKAEAAYFTAPAGSTDEYWLYVVQVERQVGEWSLIAGYAGSVVTERRSLASFSPELGLSDSIMGRVAYTISPNSSIELEGAVRRNGAGAYGSIEYSQAYGRHWRATVAAIVLGGASHEFLGQYGHNSHVMARIRYSF
jgi:hypothetical protein